VLTCHDISLQAGRTDDDRMSAVIQIVSTFNPYPTNVENRVSS